MVTFRSRAHAGQVLAGLLAQHTGTPDVVVLALPRGGVPVAFEVAEGLGAPLDVCMVRKLGFPGHEELAMGAIASGGVVVGNRQLRSLVPIDQLEAVTRAERAILEARERTYRQDRPSVPVEGRTIVIVDDGLATGSSMRAAVTALRQRSPASIVVAVPVAPAQACQDLARLADEVVCASIPASFSSVGQCYEDFSQVGDDEVIAGLARAPT